MGNYISCTLAPPMMKNTRTARVIFPTGEIKQYKSQVNVAELMLECPTFFLSNSRSLHIGHRFSALAADEELEFGNVYIFFPMKRVNSIVIAADMAVLFMAANSAAKRISGLEVKPNVIGVENDVPRLSLEGVDESGLFQNRLSFCRSRKPVLETIKEEPIWVR
ncbi:hypothetical protein TanjilG_00236 [Lupinus angustifolius]|uniref:Uncharacterized protein n=1 Tax=Lupinus angustifolius TaxID=3871 RepID=A0A1J7HJS4_LUPAN|nr:PREDICTED: uncharacterized protein LOC109360034 [Lupinus angustifolius]OIW01997.1 hypothetical protein TanjilG_00236 [Lupinus angustifolius]